jgi:signal peptidase I
MRDNQVWVNGKPVPRVHQNYDCHYHDIADENTGRWEERDCDAWQETVPGNQYVTYYDRNGPERSFYAHDQSPWHVPADAVFVMGDNRDNSHDSRFWGFVPYDLIKGKAMVTWFSIGEENPEDPPVVRWFHAVRGERMFKLIR